ncbi:hypothetical protein ACSSV1_001931 [Labrenzia sp. MBR-25]|jgi:hypothetical protein
MAEQKARMVDSRISLGNVLTILALVIGFGVQWGMFSSDLRSVREDYGRRITDLEEGWKSLGQERIREVRDLADMRADMRWIRATLERLERDLKPRK